MIPVRLQRSRSKGSKLTSPNGLPVVCVSRPGKWGNPYRPYRRNGELREHAFEMFFAYVYMTDQGRQLAAAARRDLHGKNLACWCKLCDKHRATGKPWNERCPDCKPCHADVLLWLANKPEVKE